MIIKILNALTRLFVNSNHKPISPLPVGEGLIGSSFETKKLGEGYGRLAILFSISILVISVLIAGCVSSKKEDTSGKKILFYRNPMNPQITSKVFMKDEMGMDYLPVYEKEKGEAEGEISIGQDEEALVGVETKKVVRRPLHKEIRTAGIVANDPDLFVAEQEYLGSIALSDEALVESGKKRLKVLGLNDEQIEKLEKDGEAQQSLILPSDMAWVYLTIYENEMGKVKVGSFVEVDTVAYPGEIFSGKIAAVSPVLDPMTRSLKARAEVSNPGHKLKPGMYANAVININLGNRLAVDEEAVINTGKRTIVVVSKGNGKFESRDVVLWQKADSYYEVISGLKEGDMIVTTGNFLLDSESRLRSGKKVEHQH
ncbi:efflux RND transporter periplasmic adaptor subunit [Candidatus Saganbacteria bacterium]|nr:efflux RND transporter periplasmic adaptor subunit [Candidatus Saganbacteria bacterium]